MNKYYLTAICIFLGLSGCASVSDKSSNVSVDIMALDSLVDNAFFTGDTKYLETILSENFIYVHSGAAKIETKSEALKSTARIKFTLWKRNTQEIRIYGDGTLAMASGFVTVGVKTLTPLNFYVQRLYELDGSRWQFVSQQTNFALNTEQQASEVTKYLYENYWSK